VATEVGGAAGQAALQECLAAWADGQEPARDLARTAVIWTLQRLESAAPGRSVEVRIPPLAAVQCIAGPRHTRGTPPNTVETDPRTWLGLATGAVGWVEAVADGRVRASGIRADLSRWLPIVPETDGFSR
jgi:Bacterial SCP ortholog